MHWARACFCLSDGVEVSLIGSWTPLTHCLASAGAPSEAATGRRTQRSPTASTRSGVASTSSRSMPRRQRSWSPSSRPGSTRPTGLSRSSTRRPGWRPVWPVGLDGRRQPLSGALSSPIRGPTDAASSSMRTSSAASRSADVSPGRGSSIRGHRLAACSCSSHCQMCVGRTVGEPAGSESGGQARAERGDPAPFEPCVTPREHLAMEPPPWSPSVTPDATLATTCGERAPNVTPGATLATVADELPRSCR